MILFKRRYCRKHGHDLDPDPGELVVSCRRCHSMANIDDFFEALDAHETARREWMATIGHPHDCTCAPCYIAATGGGR